ncbi:hypothetical protein E4T44_02305, partial [Aureobasidium sp. EXF-8845]
LPGYHAQHRKFGACAIRDQSCVYPSVNIQQPNNESPAAHGSRSGYVASSHGQSSSSSSLNLHPGQVHQHPASMPRLQVPRIVSDTIRRDYYLDLDKEAIAEYIEAFFRVVCGCALRVFPTTQGDNERAAQWMKEAELDALQNLEDLTIPRLQALTLLAFFEFTYHTHSTKALMFLALAARLAFAKRLNYEDHTLSVVEQESRRRLMWSIFVLDKFCSGGITELTLVPAENMDIRLPTIERAFGFGQRTDTENLRPHIEEGLPINNAKGPLLTLGRFTKRVASADESLHLLGENIRALDSSINVIERQIPQDLKWDKVHLRKRIYAPGLSSYIMLHTWRLLCKLDLHRLTVLGTKGCISEAALRNTPLSFAQTLRSECLSYAIEMTNMWADVLELGLAKPVHDAAIVGCAHQCAKILTLIPSQINFSGENRNTALYVCQMVIEPLKDIFPKAKILYDDVCRMRSEMNTALVADSSNTLQQVDEHDLGMMIPANDEDQVRSLLNQYNV